VDAIVCLHDLRDPSAVPHLINALETASNTRIREYAILALSGFTSQEIRQCLLQTLADRSISNIARMKIVMQLWRYVDLESLNALVDAVRNDPDRNVRSHAADSLAFLFRAWEEPYDWVSLWESIAEDPEIGVARFAEDALRRLGLR